MNNSRATSQRPAASVLETADTWPEVTTRVTARGATAIVLRDKELAHVHLDRATLDMPVGDERRARILKEGRAKKWFSGWVSKPIASDADAADGLALLRESYDEQRAQRHGRPGRELTRHRPKSRSPYAYHEPHHRPDLAPPRADAEGSRRLQLP